MSTIAEESLIAKQLAAITKNAQLSDALLPYQLNSMGLSIVYPDLANNPQYQDWKAKSEEYTRNWQNAPAGSGEAAEWDRKNREAWAQMEALSAPTYRKMTEDERLAGMTTLERQAYDIQKLANERELKAMRGELEIDPYVERTLAEEEAATKERLLKNLGPGALESTGGSTALADFAKRAAEARYDVAHGEMTNSEAIAQSRANQQTSNLKSLLGISSGANDTANNTVSGINIPLSWYARNREFNTQLENQDDGGGDDWGGALSGIAGSILGSFAGGIGSKAGGVVGNKLGSWLTR